MHRRRYLKDLNNQFHHGASVSFVELVAGVSEVDEARCQLLACAS